MNVPFRISAGCRGARRIAETRRSGLAALPALAQSFAVAAPFVVEYYYKVG
jgi:hypothetical protein